MDIEATPGQVPSTAVGGPADCYLNGSLHSGSNSTPGGYEPFIPTPSIGAVQGISMGPNTPAGAGLHPTAASANPYRSPNIGGTAHRFDALNSSGRVSNHGAPILDSQRVAYSPVLSGNGGADYVNSFSYTGSAPVYQVTVEGPRIT